MNPTSSIMPLILNLHSYNPHEANNCVNMFVNVVNSDDVLVTILNSFKIIHQLKYKTFSYIIIVYFISHIIPSLINDSIFNLIFIFYIP